MKKGFRLLREVDEASRFLFVADDAIEYDPDAVEKVLKKNDGAGPDRPARRPRRPRRASPTGPHAALEQAVKQYCEQKQLGLGKVAQPIRVAVSGTTVSPPIFQSLEFLGKERTLTRIERCSMQSLIPPLVLKGCTSVTTWSRSMISVASRNACREIECVASP